MAAPCIAPVADGRPCGGLGVVMDEQRGGWVCFAHAPAGPLQRRALRATIRTAMARPDRYLAAALAEETDESLAALLGCPVGWVWRLRLAGWPRTDRWHEDVQTMASAIGGDPELLAALFRRLEEATRDGA